VPEAAPRAHRCGGRIIDGTCNRCGATSGKRPKVYARKSAARRGYGRRWQRESKAFLQEHPFCKRCLARGKTVPAVVVDHIQPHCDDPELFWDRDNWQGLCKSDHDQKTATEDGGFGRPKQRAGSSVSPPRSG
jgi:5-methylcytosine-specific restriction enzyme A